MLSKDETPTFDEKVYGRIGLNDLVTYAVYYLSETGKEITAQDKRWIDCRDKRLISGNTASGFRLTPKGLELAEKTSRC